MEKTFVVLIAILCSFCLPSCARKDESYYVQKGEEIKQQLVVELEGTHSIQDLFARQESLSVLFDELARLAIEARTYQLKSKKTWGVSQEGSASSQTLAHEIQRVLEIPGARSFLEKCQTKGFEKIDAFERRAGR